MRKVVVHLAMDAKESVVEVEHKLIIIVPYVPSNGQSFKLCCYNITILNYVIIIRISSEAFKWHKIIIMFTTYKVIIIKLSN